MTFAIAQEAMVVDASSAIPLLAGDEAWIERWLAWTEAGTMILAPAPISLSSSPTDIAWPCTTRSTWTWRPMSRPGSPRWTGISRRPPWPRACLSSAEEWPPPRGAGRCVPSMSRARTSCCSCSARRSSPSAGSGSSVPRAVIPSPRRTITPGGRRLTRARGEIGVDLRVALRRHAARPECHRSRDRTS